MGNFIRGIRFRGWENTSGVNTYIGQGGSRTSSGKVYLRYDAKTGLIVCRRFNFLERILHVIFGYKKEFNRKDFWNYLKSKKIVADQCSSKRKFREVVGKRLNAFEKENDAFVDSIPKKGDQELIAELKKNPARLQLLTKTGTTLLVEACRHKKKGLAEFLLEQGADVNTGCTSAKCETPLFLAVQAGELALVELLVKNGANVNITRRYNIYRIIRPKIKPERSDLLIFGSGVRCEEVFYEKTAFSLACMFGFQDIAKLLVQKENAKITTSDLAWAFRTMDVETFKFLTEKGKRNLKISLANDIVNRIKREEKGGIDSFKFRFYDSGLKYHRLSCIYTRQKKEKISSNEDIEEEYHSRLLQIHDPLDEAAQVGDLEVIKYLLGIVADEPKDRVWGAWSALCHAVENNHPNVIEFLVDEIMQGAGKNAPYFLTSSLNKAIALANDGLIKYFIEKGADLNLKAVDWPLKVSIEGHWRTSTPLEVAMSKTPSEEKGREILRLLLDRGADLKKMSSKGLIRVDSMFCHSDENYVRLLLEYGFNPMALEFRKDPCDPFHEEERCPLLHHLATRDTGLKALRLVLEKRPDLINRQWKGNTMLVLAKKYDCPETEKFLKEKGASLEGYQEAKRRSLSWEINYGCCCCGFSV